MRKKPDVQLKSLNSRVQFCPLSKTKRKSSLLIFVQTRENTKVALPTQKNSITIFMTIVCDRKRNNFLHPK